MSERGCYERVGPGYCRNKYYRTIGASPGRYNGRGKLWSASVPPHDRRCLKHWLQWQKELMNHLFGLDWEQWIGVCDE